MVGNKFYGSGDTVGGGTIVDIMPERISVRFPSGIKEFSIGAFITDGKQPGSPGK
jgi:hypothetical protein